jgi:hypothetical protein
MEEGYKDLVDFEVLRWTMKYVHQGVEPQLVVFVSGDGHFLTAANEAKKRGKEVEFWLVDKEKTSGAILRFETYHEIQKMPLPMMTEPNSFIGALNSFNCTQGPNGEEKSKVILLQRAVEILSVYENQLSIEERREKAIQNLTQALGVSEKDANEILKALLVMEGIRFHPVASTSLYVDSALQFLQWLKQKASTLT